MKELVSFVWHASTIFVFYFSANSQVQAQTISPDGTIPTNVEQQGKVFEITGGTARESNLFHSFSEFVLNTGNEAFFNNPTNISNIITRVTGGNPSSLDGLIRANNANLFFLNPAGIFFGPNASLNIGGSFYGSTADSWLFPEGEFSAIDPANKTVLTINAPIGLNFRDNPQPIINQSVADGVGLQVNSEETLALIGGEVELDGGLITAPGGQVELGGLSAAGKIGIEENGSLTFPDGVARADISMTNGAVIDVRADGGGEISINARDLLISGASELVAGIAENSGSLDAQAGNITINATETIAVSQESGIVNRVNLNASGKSGDIKIQTTDLSLTNGGIVSAGTFGNGDAGNIIINASKTVTLDATENPRTGIASNVLPSGAGDGGNINLNANYLSIFNGAEIIASTFGKGNAGNINIDVENTLTVSGFFATIQGYFQQSAISSEVQFFDNPAEGNAGNINIQAGSLKLEDFSKIGTGTFGLGNAGNISIQTDGAIFLANLSSIRSNVEQGSVGNAGNIDIQGRSLTITDGGQIVSGVFRESVDVPGGRGEGGNINITTRDFVDISGYSTTQLPISDPGDPSQPFSTAGFSSLVGTNTERGATGAAGNIIVTTNVFRLSDGGTIENFTFNYSNGGNVTINANTFEVTGGGQIISTTSSGGNAGDIKLNIVDSILITGKDPNFANRLKLAAQFGSPEDIIANQGAESGLFANATENATGNSGSIFIDPNQFTLADTAKVSVDNQGQGNAGIISIQADSLQLDNQATISAITASGAGGNIQLNVPKILSLRDNSSISAEALNNANGGNIDINADFIIAFANQNNDILASAEQGIGGNINITTQGIFGIQERKQNPFTNDIDASSEFSLDGSVSINTPDVEVFQQTAETPENVAETDAIVGGLCEATQTAEDILAGTTNTFVIKGKGGIPPQPTEPFTADNILINTQSIPVDAERQRRRETEERTLQEQYPPIMTSQGAIYPARGIIRNPDGTVTLTAYPTTNTIQRTLDESTNCGN